MRHLTIGLPRRRKIHSPPALAEGPPLQAIAGKVDLRSSARPGQAFERRFGMAPSLLREMHG